MAATDRVPVADYRHPEATRKNNPPAKIAAEGHHLIRGGHVTPRDEARLLATEIQALRTKRGGDGGRDIGVGLGAGEVRRDLEAAGGGEPLAVDRGQHALGGAVKTDEEDTAMVTHE